MVILAVNASRVLTLEKIGIKKDFMIEDIDEQIKSVNMILVIRRSTGEVIKLSKIVDEDEVVTILYIPQIDTSIHGMNMGESFDGTLFRKFSFFLREEEESLYSDVINDFLSSGWDFSFDARGID
jgi:hypothetical protein